MAHESFFIGEPRRVSVSSNGSILWEQRIQPVPDSLLRLRKVPYPCKDGFFRSLEFAFQERLISEKLVKGKLDACTNIPWRFFQQHAKERPYDLRVKAILRHFKKRGLSAQAIKLAIQPFSFTGFPDLLEFKRDGIAAWEIKSMLDKVSSNQYDVHRFLNSHGITVNIVQLIEDGRSRNEYRDARSNHLKRAKRCWADFWTSEFSNRLYEAVVAPALVTDLKQGFYPIVSNSSGAMELRSVKTAPAAIIDVLARYLVSYLRNDTSSYGLRRELFRKELKVSGLDISELANASFSAGASKWWKIAPLLLPFVTDTKERPELTDTLVRSFEWEEKFRTEHMSMPYLGHYRSALHSRTEVNKLSFSKREFTAAYRDMTTFNAGNSSTCRRTFARKLKLLPKITGYTLVPMRESYQFD